MSNYSEKDYTFVVCAYKESPYLEECIKSLLNQDIHTNIVLTTSTPNQYLEQMAYKYKIPYYVNDEKGNIATDWNYAYKTARTSIVTLAHQDDVYTKEFARETLENINECKHPLIAFTDYGEMRNGLTVTKNRLLQLKRIMLSPLKIKLFRKSRFTRRRILSMGSAICCPSVTMVKDNLPEKLFDYGFRSNIDWQAWERISKLKGEFVYCDKILMYHRIHEGSETSAIIADNNRVKEDYAMYCVFWPKPIARLLMKFYVKGQDSNSI